MSATLERFRWLIAGLFAVPFIAGLAWLGSDRLDDDPSPLVIESGDSAPQDIRVYVAGAVVNPGVYPLPEDARWIDAIEVAGGLTADADETAINLARRIVDEDEIIVPAVGAAVQPDPDPVGPVNLNTASLDELEALPGIGEVRAEAIIDSRTEDGPFTQIEDLLLRELIPDGVYEEIASMITID
jgi:competence protein ComEA